MIDILYNCFNSLNFYIILFIGFLLYYFNNKNSIEKLNKQEEKDIIDSIIRRSEECPQQYPNGWLPVYDSRDLKKGEVKPIFALGRDLVIYRGMSGKVNVFGAYCPHLGANLGVGGTVVGDDIKCPFHGWQFNNQGDCDAIPGLDENKLPRSTIKKWRCDEVNDFIYVWHHSDQKEPDWFIPKIDKIENHIYRGRFSKIIHCYIQEIAENESDLVHFKIIHGTDSLIPNFLKTLVKIELIPSWKILAPPNSHCAIVELKVNLKIVGITYSENILGQQIGPAILNMSGILLNKLKIYLNLNIITLGPMKQQFYLRIYSEPTILGLLFSPIILLCIGFVVNQDVPIWNRKKYLHLPTFTKLDETIIKFRRWYKQFYSLNSKYD